MGARKILRAINPLRRNDEAGDRPVLTPGWDGEVNPADKLSRLALFTDTPIVDPRILNVGYTAPPAQQSPQMETAASGSMDLPNRRQRLGMPGDVPYNPPSTTDVGSELQKRSALNVSYAPQQPTNATEPLLRMEKIPLFEAANTNVATTPDQSAPITDATRARRVTPAPQGPGPASVIYGPQGQPRSVEGGADDLDRQQAYLQALEDYKVANHNSRLKSGGIGFGRGYERGGLVGGIVGGIAHLINPKMDEEFANRRDIAKTQGRVAQDITYKQSQSKLEDDAAKRELERAEAHKALNPTYRPTIVNSDQGLFRDQDGKLTPLTDPKTGKPLTHATKPTNQTTTKWVVDPKNPNQRTKETWRVDASGQPVAKTNEVSEVYKPGYGWSPAGQARTADALAGQRQFEDKRQTAEDAYKKTKDEQERVDKADATRKDQARLTGKIDASIKEISAHQWQIQQLYQKQGALNPKDQYYASDKIKLDDEIRKEQAALAKAQADGTAAATELNTGHGELFESGMGEGGFPYYKKKPLSVSKWRLAHPQGNEKLWRQNAKDQGFEVIP